MKIDESLDILSQYNQIKAANPNKIVLFKIGSFYEVLGNDVAHVAKILNIKATRKQVLGESIPLCGFPVRSKIEYIKRLLENGLSIVTVDEGVKSKKSVARYLSDVITPSTAHVVEEYSSYSLDSSYIASITSAGGNAQILFTDISTGEAFLEYTKNSKHYVISRLKAYDCREILIGEEYKTMFGDRQYSVNIITPEMIVEDQEFAKNSGILKTLTDKEKLLVWQLFGYINSVKPGLKFSINSIRRKYKQDRFYVSYSSLVNLSILNNDKDDHNTLFHILNKTKTAIGRRALQSLMIKSQSESSQSRLNAISYLIANPEAISLLDVCLSQIYDIERIAFRGINNNTSAQDIMQFVESFISLDAFLQSDTLMQILDNVPSANVVFIYSKLRNCGLKSTVDNKQPISPELRQEFYEIIVESFAQIKQIINFIGALDVILSFTNSTMQHGWVRPEFSGKSSIYIKDGYHPIYKALFPEKELVTNDFESDNDKKIMLISGPNMSGKSVYLKQVGLICFMARIGCYVPCKSATIPYIDAIFTRIGSSDKLYEDKSTFYVEMEEISEMLNDATENSLCIIDELGRGTNLEDGISISRKVLRYFHKYIGATVLCASHIGEIVSGKDLNGCRQYYFDVKIDRSGEIYFPYKIEKGIILHSVLKEICKTVGLPAEIWNL